MFKHRYFCLLSLVLFISPAIAMLPDLGISATTCCIYATMSCLCCSSGIQACCREHEYKKLSSDITNIKDGISRINRNLPAAPQSQKMTPHNTQNKIPPSLRELKNTTEQSSNTDLSLITPTLPRRSLDKKMPQTPPLLKESE